MKTIWQSPLKVWSCSYSDLAVSAVEKLSYFSDSKLAKNFQLRPRF